MIGTRRPSFLIPRNSNTDWLADVPRLTTGDPLNGVTVLPAARNIPIHESRGGCGQLSDFLGSFIARSPIHNVMLRQRIYGLPSQRDRVRESRGREQQDCEQAFHKPSKKSAFSFLGTRLKCFKRSQILKTARKVS